MEQSKKGFPLEKSIIEEYSDYLLYQNPTQYLDAKTRKKIENEIRYRYKEERGRIFENIEDKKIVEDKCLLLDYEERKETAQINKNHTGSAYLSHIRSIGGGLKKTGIKRDYFPIQNEDGLKDIAIHLISKQACKSTSRSFRFAVLDFMRFLREEKNIEISDKVISCIRGAKSAEGVYYDRIVIAENEDVKNAIRYLRQDIPFDSFSYEKKALALMIEIMYLTGARIGEVLNIKHKDINIKIFNGVKEVDWTQYISKKRGKNNARLVPLDSLVDSLEDFLLEKKGRNYSDFQTIEEKLFLENEENILFVPLNYSRNYMEPMVKETYKNWIEKFLPQQYHYFSTAHSLRRGAVKDMIENPNISTSDGARSVGMEGKNYIHYCDNTIKKHTNGRELQMEIMKKRGLYGL